MTTPPPSPRTSRFIQVGAAAALLVVYGGMFAAMAATYGDDALASLFVGGAISLVGIALATTSAARIDDSAASSSVPSASASATPC